jgi:phosphate-selective porin
VPPPQVAPPAQVDPPAQPAPSPAPPAPRASLDYSDGTFYLRAANDNVIIVPSARVHIDTYAFAGPGIGGYRKSNGAGLVPNMFFRRFILEMGGLIRRDWSFWIGGNFAPTQIDANQNPSSTAAVYDGFLAYEPTRGLRLHAGQYNTPVTMENVTSSRWLDFMERALTVRTLAAPYNKDIGFLAWGRLPKGYFEFQAGLFGGDGMNRANVDDYPEAMGRVVVRPLAGIEGATRLLHLGGSTRYGYRHKSHVFYDAPAMTTPGGFAYWSPVSGTGPTETHVIPSRDQLAVAGELYVPFERFDLRGEVAYISEGRREAPASARGETLREGMLKGTAGYVQLSVWPLGTPRINGNPAGEYGRVRLPTDAGAEAPYGLQLVARAERVRVKYGSADRSGVPSSPTQAISVDAAQIAANYWATKHVRLTLEYSLYSFPEAPRRDLLHEFSCRIGLAL